MLSFLSIVLSIAFVVALETSAGVAEINAYETTQPLTSGTVDLAVTAPVTVILSDDILSSSKESDPGAPNEVSVLVADVEVKAASQQSTPVEVGTGLGVPDGGSVGVAEIEAPIEATGAIQHSIPDEVGTGPGVPDEGSAWAAEVETQVEVGSAESEEVEESASYAEEENILLEVDTDEDGFVSYEEAENFLLGEMEQDGLSNREMKRAQKTMASVFLEADADEDGELDENEFEHLLDLFNEEQDREVEGKDEM
jgi:hypothetical protein